MGKCHKRCSKFSTLLSMHALYRQTVDWRTYSNTLDFVGYPQQQRRVLQPDLYRNLQSLHTELFSVHPKGRKFCYKIKRA